jgi:hypothetical protein
MARVKQKLICKKCQSPFETKRYWQVFCSKACRYNYHNDIRLDALHAYQEREKASERE